MTTCEEARTIFEPFGEVISIKLINYLEARLKIGNLISNLDRLNDNVALIEMKSFQNIEKLIEKLSGNQKSNWRNHFKIIKIGKAISANSGSVKKCSKKSVKNITNLMNTRLLSKSELDIDSVKYKPWNSFKSKKSQSKNLINNSIGHLSTYKSCIEQARVSLIRSSKGPDDTKGFDLDSIKKRIGRIS